MIVTKTKSERDGEIAPGQGACLACQERFFRYWLWMWWKGRGAGQRAASTWRIPARALHVASVVRDGAGHALAQVGASLDRLGWRRGHAGQGFASARTLAADALDRLSVKRERTGRAFFLAGAGVNGLLRWLRGRWRVVVVIRRTRLMGGKASQGGQRDASEKSQGSCGHLCLLCGWLLWQDSPSSAVVRPITKLTAQLSSSAQACAHVIRKAGSDLRLGVPGPSSCSARISAFVGVLRKRSFIATFVSLARVQRKSPGSRAALRPST